MIARMNWAGKQGTCPREEGAGTKARGKVFQTSSQSECFVWGSGRGRQGENCIPNAGVLAGSKGGTRIIDPDAGTEVQKGVARHRLKIRQSPRQLANVKENGIR